MVIIIVTARFILENVYVCTYYKCVLLCLSRNNYCLLYKVDIHKLLLSALNDRFNNYRVLQIS